MRDSVVAGGFQRLLSVPWFTIPLVRIGTWNLDRERARRASAERRAILDGLDLDVAVITEPGPWWDRPAVLSCPGRPPMRTGSPPDSWVAIEGGQLEAVDLDLSYGRMAAAARGMIRGVEVAVYGSVLPWNGISESGILQPGESYREAFPRILSEQAADVRRLAGDHAESILIWAGDFNQALAPPHRVGSAAHRHLLQQTLDGLGLVAWNGDEPAARNELRTIDLICGSSECDVKSIERIPVMVESLRFSDHLGYVVEIQPHPRVPSEHPPRRLPDRTRGA